MLTVELNVVVPDEFTARLCAPLTAPVNVALPAPLVTVVAPPSVVVPVTAKALPLVRYVPLVVRLPLYCCVPVFVTPAVTIVGAFTVKLPPSVSAVNVMVFRSVIATAFAPLLLSVTAPWKSLPADVSVIGAAPAVTDDVPVTTRLPDCVIALPPLLATSAPVTVP